MGQDNVMDVLEKYYPEWLTADDIRSILDYRKDFINISTIRQNLRRLYSRNIIDRRNSGIGKIYEWRKK